MKKIASIFLFFIAMGVTGRSQDTLFFIDGHTSLVKNIVIGPSIISYDSCYSPAGKKVSILKKTVRLISYSSGAMQVISVKNLPLPKDQAMFNKGITDAQIYYTSNGGAVGTGVLSFLTGGIIGLIPAIACSSAIPKTINLGIPSNAPVKNKDYLLGYVSQAKKIKQNRVWTGYLLGLVGLAGFVYVLTNGK